ncbi:MAG TPA: tail fiber domain-containing protein [Dyadobacter sp.]|nr:tail fiber domain-containing protein [Dyadobacter sp.]
MPANGTYAAPTPVADGDVLGGIYFSPYIASGFHATNASILGIYKGTGEGQESALTFNASGGQERMRINQDGDVTIGVVDPFIGFTENSRLSLQTPSGVGQWIRSSSSDLNGLLTLEKAAAGTGLHQFVMFRAGGTYYGNISAGAGSGVTYNSTSDQRLKENIRDTKYGIEDLMKIQVSDYNYKANKATNHTGYIAQQLYTVFPEAVTQRWRRCFETMDGRLQQNDPTAHKSHSGPAS